MKIILTLVGLAFFNFFISTKTHHAIYVLGSEFILAGLYVFVRSKTMIPVFQKFFMEYPFIHYLGKNRLTPTNLAVKAIGLVLIAVGVAFVLFGPTNDTNH